MSLYINKSTYQGNILHNGLILIGDSMVMLHNYVSNYMASATSTEINDIYGIAPGNWATFRDVTLQAWDLMTNHTSASVAGKETKFYMMLHDIEHLIDPTVSNTANIIYGYLVTLKNSTRLVTGLAEDIYAHSSAGRNSFLISEYGLTTTPDLGGYTPLDVVRDTLYDGVRRFSLNSTNTGDFEITAQYRGYLARAIFGITVRRRKDK